MAKGKLRDSGDPTHARKLLWRRHPRQVHSRKASGGKTVRMLKGGQLHERQPRRAKMGSTTTVQLTLCTREKKKCLREKTSEDRRGQGANQNSKIRNLNRSHSNL